MQRIANRIYRFAIARPNTAAATLIVLCSMLFLPAVTGDFFSDDVYYIKQNSLLQDLPLGEIYKILYTRTNPFEFLPLRDLTYKLEYELFGLNPMPYHLNNIILYALTCFAVWFFARAFLRRFNQEAYSPEHVIVGALSITALFAVHPAHVESVAWISGRKELLSGLLATASLFIFTLSYDKRWRIGRLLVVYALFTLALLSKSTVITLPLFMLVMALAPVMSKPFHAKKALIAIIATAPMFALSLVSYAINISVGTSTRVAATPLTKILMESESLIHRISIPIKILGYFVQISVAPVGLRLIYDVNGGGIRDQSAIILGVSLIALFLWSMFNLFNNKHTQTRMGIVMFTVFSIPFLQIVPFNTISLASERFLFLPVIGAAIAIVAIIRRHVSGYKILLLLTLLMASVTASRSVQWRDPESLFISNLKYSLGNIALSRSVIPKFLERGMYDKALFTANKIRDKRFRHRYVLWITAYMAYIENPQESHTEIKKRLEAVTTRSSAARIHWLLGRAHESEGNDFEAARHYYYGVEQRVPEAKDDLKRLLHRYTPEINRLASRIEEEPDNFETGLELARLYMQLYQVERARNEYSRLLAFSSVDSQKALVHFNMGLNESNAGNNKAALELFRLSLQEGYVTSEVLNHIGISYRDIGDVLHAEEYFIKSMELDRTNYKPVFNLAVLMRVAGDKQRAMELFLQSQRLMLASGISAEMADIEISLLDDN